MKSKGSRKSPVLLLVVASCSLLQGMDDLDQLGAPPSAPSDQQLETPSNVEQDVTFGPQADPDLPAPVPASVPSDQQPDQQLDAPPNEQQDVTFGPQVDPELAVPVPAGVPSDQQPDQQLDMPLNEQQDVPFGPEVGQVSPAPVAVSAPMPAAQMSPDEMQGAAVTTLNEERGNWFFKAKILKDARKAYEKIRKKLVKIEPLEDTYAEQRNKIDQELNAFYLEYGFQSGEVDERLDILLEEIKKLEDQEGRLDTKEERELLADLQQKKEDVAAVTKELEELRTLDMVLSQAIATLAAQVNKANVYDEQSWEHYEKIELTLSDELAQELLNKIENAFENIITIEKYLDNDFKAFFTQSIGAITEHIEKIKKLVVDLKDQGIGLGKKMNELLAKEEAAKQELADRERARLEKELAEARKTWWNSFTDSFARAWNSIQNLFVSAYSSVTGWFVSVPQEKVRKEADVSEVVDESQSSDLASVAVPKEGSDTAA